MSTPQFVQSMKQVADHLKKAQEILGGSLDYYFQKLVEHSEALLTRYAPLRVGDKAVIVRPVSCTGGWVGRERTLAVGATGTITDVDYKGGLFSFLFLPDHEWWTDHHGVERETDDRGHYRLGEKHLGPIFVAQRDNPEGK